MRFAPADHPVTCAPPSHRDFGRASAQSRAIDPFAAEPPHPRAAEMADRMREAAGTFGGVTYADLIAAGFTSAEIIEHEAVARALFGATFVRQVAPLGDRVPDFVAKAIAAAAHRMPCTAGEMPTNRRQAAWDLYCRARAAWKLDPWLSQSERCLALLDAFLRLFPLLDRERNRIVAELAKSQKADAMNRSVQ